MKIDKEIGEGPEYVYAYYFPSQAKGDSWPHKIGRAKRDPLVRIQEQQASMQEMPIIGTLVKCQNSFYIEALLHTYLKSRQMASTFGREWFDIHPMAIENALLDGPALLPIGQQIRLARLDQKFSQALLAKAAGLRQATVSDLERGRDKLLSTLLEVARELKMVLALVKLPE